MTQDEIISIAEEAGYDHPDAIGLCAIYDFFSLEKFAALVAAKAAEEEREACAQVCEMHIDKHEAEKAKKRVESAQKCCDEASELQALRHELVVSTFNAGIKTCAKSIRARGGNV